MAAVVVINWWALALRGVFAILFGIIAIVWPGLTAAVLVLLFGAYALLDGIFALVAGLRAAAHHGRSSALLVEGILNILIAIIVFLWPGAALVALIYLIALWAIISGVALIAAGMALVRLAGEILLIVAGILSILLGAVLFISPAAGVIALSWWFGIYALLFGIVLVSAAFRIRYHPI
ncbi:MAG: HdeD family acid-resistance protein [Alphaproteobacteria bacterium]|nr:HdeD family acid-resistance protein [Alphaproteobacteria bacterium]